MALPLCRLVQLGLPERRWPGAWNPAVARTPPWLFKEWKKDSRAAGKAQARL